MSIHLTKDFDHAIQARVSLERHEFSQAIAAADEIIPNYPLASSEAEIRSLWTNDQSSEILVGLYVSPQEGKSAGPSYIGFNYSANLYMPDYVLCEKVIGFYEDNDYGEAGYFMVEDILVGGSDYEEVTLVSKYQGNPTFDD